MRATSKADASAWAAPSWRRGGGSPPARFGLGCFRSVFRVTLPNIPRERTSPISRCKPDTNPDDRDPHKSRCHLNPTTNHCKSRCRTAPHRNTTRQTRIGSARRPPAGKHARVQTRQENARVPKDDRDGNADRSGPYHARPTFHLHERAAHADVPSYPHRKEDAPARGVPFSPAQAHAPEYAQR